RDGTGGSDRPCLAPRSTPAMSAAIAAQTSFVPVVLGKPGADLLDQSRRPQHTQHARREAEEEEDDQPPRTCAGKLVEHPADERATKDTCDELAGQPQRDAHARQPGRPGALARFPPLGSLGCQRPFKIAAPTIEIVRLIPVGHWNLQTRPAGQRLPAQKASAT